MRIRPLVVLLLLALGVPASQAAAADTIILKREPGLDRGERADLRSDAGVRFVESLPLPRTELVRAPDVHAALRELEADPDVEYAQVNHVRRAFADPAMGEQWALANDGHQLFDDDPDTLGVADADSDVVEAWSLLDAASRPITGQDQIVAVVDTGIWAAHPDLAGRIGIQQNFVGTEIQSTAPDGDGHGTHVSGTIAASRNTVGGAGVAPSATIMALKALDDTGQGTDADIAEALDYAGDQGVRVVNASLGGPEPAPALADAMADHPSTLYVVAAGNDGTNNDATPQYPCNTPLANVLCVGASTNRDGRASFSNFGAASVDLFAPGEWILSTVPEDGYEYWNGTSMASPHVAATAALVMQAKPTLTAAEVKDVLLQTGDYKAAFAGRSVTGRRLNAEAAVRLALAGGPEPDGDTDGFSDSSDGCGTIASSDTSDGCPDRDRDGVTDADDNCPTVANTNQKNSDGRSDGGDACDADYDNDGKPNGSDACPTVYGTATNGCPPPAPKPPAPTPVPPPPAPPAPPPVPVADRDSDGIPDASDSCPTERGGTRNGCPTPAVSSLSAKSRKRRGHRRRTLRVRVGTTRAAELTVVIKRKRGRRWVRVSRRTRETRDDRVTIRLKRVKRGRYRVRVAISSDAGAGATVTKRFRVR